MANNNHKPLKRNILDCLTDTNVNINVNELCSALDNVTIFREIRILNGVLYRLYGNNNVVYKIRMVSHMLQVCHQKHKHISKN